MIRIPTLQELKDTVLTNIETEYGDNVPTFGRIFLNAIAGMQAAKLKMLYYAIANVQKNIFVDTAERESGGGTLERFARIKLGRNPFPAVSAQYTVSVSGTTGATIPANQTFKSDDDSINPGMLFILDVAKTLTGPTGTMTLRALTSGLSSRLDIGDTLTATSPIANVNSGVTVTVEVVEPQAEEDIEQYRDSAIEAYRLEPQGGAAADYRLWSKDAQGVQQSYPYAKSGAANEINIFVEATIADSVDNKGTPSAALLTRVQQVVEFDPDVTKPQSERGRRPLGVFDIHYLSVTISQVDIICPSFVNLTPAIQTAITNAMRDMVSSHRPFIAACDVLEDKNDILDVNQVVATILLAQPGASFGTIIMNIGGIPFSTYTFINGNIPYFNSITFP